MAVEPSSPYAKSKDGKLEADLKVTLRISDHSPAADFFGAVAVRFTELDVAPRGSEKIIWQANKCHRDRGLPKVSIAAIEGTIVNGQVKTEVSAIPRHIGKLIPPDEIIVTKQPPGRLNDSTVTELAIRGRTKLSHLLLELRLSALRCLL